jgi:hypothetical protein
MAAIFYRRQSFCDEAAVSHILRSSRLASRPPVIFVPSQPYSGYVAAPGTIVLSPHRTSMPHNRKTDFKIISFQRDIAGKINGDGEAATPHLEFWRRRPSATSAVLSDENFRKLSGKFPETFRKVSGNFARESFHCGKFPKRGFCADLARLRPNLQLIST